MNDRSIAMGSVLLRNMPEHSAQALHGMGVQGAIKSGEVLFREGDAANSVFIVLSGLLKLSRIDRQGNEAVVAIQRPGDSIATALAFSKNTYPVSCTALADSRYLAISNKAIRTTVLSSQETMGAVLAATYAHLHELVDQVAQLKANSTQKRVARFLVSLCDTTEGHAEIKLPYEKVVIAGVLGMTPETLSRSFAKLKDRGVTVEGNKVRIDRVESLTHFLDLS